MQPNPLYSTAHMTEEEEEDEDFYSIIFVISTALNTNINITKIKTAA